MSAEEEKDVAGDVPAEETAGEKPAAKKPAAKQTPSKNEAPSETQAASRKGARRKPATGEASQTAAGKAAAAEEPVAPKETKEAKEPSAAKGPPAAKEPTAGKGPEAQKQPGAPARRKPRAATAPRRRVVRARARYVRTSARKARMVCGHLRGKSVQEARAILAFTPREVARDWSKLLESAVANAESNHELLEDDLIVREAFADEGPTIKRFRPRAMGRATPIRKRTSHLTITLTTGPEPRTTKRRS